MGKRRKRGSKTVGLVGLFSFGCFHTEIALKQDKECPCLILMKRVSMHVQKLFDVSPAVVKPAAARPAITAIGAMDAIAITGRKKLRPGMILLVQGDLED
jgi:hypothetical protein